MLHWIRMLFGDPNGDGHAAIGKLKEQRVRSSQVSNGMGAVAEQLRLSREAVQAKVQAIQEEEERVSQEGLRPAKAIEC